MREEERTEEASPDEEVPPEEAPSDDQARMTLTEHLEELRWRILFSLGAILVAAVGCYQAMAILMAWLRRPLDEIEGSAVTIIGTGVAEAFFTKLKLSIIAGIFVASPVVLYQIWKFVAPGLYPEERRYALPFVFFGTIFFVSGALFCYHLVFPTAYSFFIAQYESVGIAPYLRISEYLSFSARLLLAFGVVFEMPLFTFFFARIGLVTHRKMVSWWRYAIIGIFAVAAVLTPGPDVASQMLMAGPLLVLYAASIGIAWAFAKERPGEEAEEETPDDEEPPREQ